MCTVLISFLFLPMSLPAMDGKKQPDVISISNETDKNVAVFFRRVMTSPKMPVPLAKGFLSSNLTLKPGEKVFHKLGKTTYETKELKLPDIGCIKKDRTPQKFTVDYGRASALLFLICAESKESNTESKEYEIESKEYEIEYGATYSIKLKENSLSASITK